MEESESTCISECEPFELEVHGSSVIPSSFPSNDITKNDNMRLEERVSYLEKQIHHQNQEITFLKESLVDALRRIDCLECDGANRNVTIQKAEDNCSEERNTIISKSVIGSGSKKSVIDMMTPSDNSYQSSKHGSAKSSGLYNSSGSLHSDGHSSSSLSPSPSPICDRQGKFLNVCDCPASNSPSLSTDRSKALSGSATNLTNSRKWNSTSDFRDYSPNVINVLPRKLQKGSLRSLKSSFSSQQNLSRLQKHGTKDISYNSQNGVLKMCIYGKELRLITPSSLLDTFSPYKVSPAPSEKLKLEWVYGYRGRDARSNLYLLPTGEMVYFIAAVVVLHNAEEQTQRHYLGHTDEIKCLTVHPNKLLVATGQTTQEKKGGWPHVRIWNTVSLTTHHILGIGEFEKSIHCLSFSRADGGNLLVVIDDAPDHTISVWDWQRSERGSKITESKCSSETVVAAEFHPLESGVIVTCGKGHVNFWQLDGTSLTLSRKTGCFDQRDKPKYVTCLAFSYTGDLLTGDSNGNIFIWGRGYNVVTKAIKKVHDGPVFSIYVLKDGTIITGGGKDRKVIQFDTLYRRTNLEAELSENMGSVRTITQGKDGQLLLGTTKNSILLGTFEQSFHEIVSGHVDDVWSLAVHPQQNQFISSSYDWKINLWDSLSHSPIWSSDVGEKTYSACFSNDGEVVLIGLGSGKWMVLDSRTREVYGIYQDGSEPIQLLKFSPNGMLLAIGSLDNVLYLYQVLDQCKKYVRMGRCMGQYNLHHLDWSIDSKYIQANSDNEISYWNASTCREISNHFDMRDVDWFTQTCPLSFNTIGVLSEIVDGPNIITCGRSNDSKYLVTGDNMGKIKMFSYPVTQLKSLYHINGGHSSQITRLEFLWDDSRLISCGSNDHAIMQWNITH